jgi:hypothetical protein
MATKRQAVEGQMKLLPVKPGACPYCAVEHPDHWPHNKDSLYYQMQFYGRFQRWPTWGDACAHCDGEMREFWMLKIGELGGEWTDHSEPIAQDPAERARQKEST